MSSTTKAPSQTSSSNATTGARRLTAQKRARKPTTLNSSNSNNVTPSNATKVAAPPHLALKISKRPATKPIQRPNDIYVTNKTNFSVQLKRCSELLQKVDIHEVYLHSVGNAITRCINLALTLVADSNGGLGYEANTSTIQMIDNQHPLHDDDDFTISQRLNSCLHVRVFRHSKDLLSVASGGKDD